MEMGMACFSLEDEFLSPLPLNQQQQQDRVIRNAWQVVCDSPQGSPFLVFFFSLSSFNFRFWLNVKVPKHNLSNRQRSWVTEKQKPDRRPPNNSILVLFLFLLFFSFLPLLLLLGGVTDEHRLIGSAGWSVTVLDPRYTSLNWWLDCWHNPHLGYS